MPTVETLSLHERNAPAVQVALTLDDAPWDLTGRVVRFVVKEDSRTADADADIDWRSDDADPRITITNAVGGLARIQFEVDDLATPGARFHRIDVIDGTRPLTARYGPFVVVDT